MRVMMGTRGIRVGTRGIRVGMRESGRECGEWGVGMRRIRVRMAYKHLTGILQGFC